MMDELAHRGPDGSGMFLGDGVALGHRRLAIIDLTDAGLQPFARSFSLIMERFFQPIKNTSVPLPVVNLSHAMLGLSFKGFS